MGLANASWVPTPGVELCGTISTMRLLATVALAVMIAASGARAEGVGFRDIDIEVDGERLITALWYPTDGANGRTAVGPFTMDASRGAPLGDGWYGLVLLSHGTGGGRLNHRDTAIRLAESGYIVAAPEHAGDSWRDGRYSGTAENWRRRPRQLSAVLDRLLGDAAFGPHIDPARIGAIGHSAGGYSVLALIGGRVDMAVLAHHCTRHRDEDAEFCSYGRPGGQNELPMPDLADRRVAAVVAVAPVGALFGDGAFSGVAVPAQIHRLDADSVLREPWHAEHIAALMGDHATLVTHPEAHHFAFITPFPAALADQVGAAGRDPADFDRRAFLTEIDEQILRFFDDALPAP